MNYRILKSIIDVSHLGHTKVFNWLFGAWTTLEVESRKTVESKPISLTVYVSLLIITRSPTSNGCLMSKKIILLRTSVRLPPISQLKPKNARGLMSIILQTLETNLESRRQH